MRTPPPRFLLLSGFLLLATSAYGQYQPQQQQRYPPQQQQYQQQPNQQQYGQNQQYNTQQRMQPGQQGYQQQQMNPYQQQQNGQQGYQNQMNRGGMMQQPQNAQNPKSGRTVVVNTPTKLQSAVSNAATSTDGAQVDIRLTSYSNPDLSLSNVTTCSCPTQSCAFLSQTQQNDCSISFTTVISAKDQSVQYIQSDFYPFGGQISAGNWTNPYSFPMRSKPVAIDVFVQHLGVVIDKTTSNLLFFNHLTLIDSFVVDISSYIPGLNSNARTFTLQGKQLNTQLQMTLNVQCINGKLGDMCDLSCPTSTFDNVICTDSDGRNTSCKWNSYKNQVSGCQICNQVGANGTCAQYLVENRTGVSSAFRTWTIVLGCLLGIAVLFILCLIIMYIIIKNRESQENDKNAYNSQVGNYGNEKPSSTRPLLDDEWTGAPHRRTSDLIDTRHPADDSYSPRTGNGGTSRQEHQV